MSHDKNILNLWSFIYIYIYIYIFFFEKRGRELFSVSMYDIYSVVCIHLSYLAKKKKKYSVVCMFYYKTKLRYNILGAVP